MTICAKCSDLRAFRIRAGLSLKALSNRCGLTTETLCKVEGGRPIRPQNAAKICAALGCEFDDIFTLHGGDGCG